MSYPEVTIELCICCFLGPTSLCVVLPIWYLIFSGPLVRTKIEVSSLTPEHIIKSDELRFSIGLPTDWQSLIGRLCLNQADQLYFS
jgi:hypothetical protein